MRRTRWSVGTEGTAEQAGAGRQTAVPSCPIEERQAGVPTCASGPVGRLSFVLRELRGIVARRRDTGGVE